MYRILTSDCSRTTTELVEMAVHGGVGESLSVQNPPWRCVRPLHRAAVARRTGES